MNHSNQKLEGRAVHKKPIRQEDPVWVQCEGYRCLATKDSRGKWRSYHNGAPLEGVIEVLAVSTESGCQIKLSIRPQL